MPKLHEPNSELQITMPRREFIRKSLIASGGVFVGMTTLGNVSLPELTGSRKPSKPSSGNAKGGTGNKGGRGNGDHDDDDGGTGWGRW
jgi:hypothetical protein